ncbi:Uncharacterised protein [Pseudomonas aeruginosa]|nr:Uncharacterised protein [Pseudomonas aeruginosa]
MKPLAPNSRERCTTAASSCAGDHHHRHLRVLPAQQHQAGEAIGPRHVEVQQDQIPIGLLVQPRFQFGDAGGFHQAHVGAQPEGEGLVQSAAKQGVIVGDQDLVRSHDMS